MAAVRLSPHACFYCTNPVDRWRPHVRAIIQHWYRDGTAARSRRLFHVSCLAKFTLRGRPLSPKTRYLVLGAVFVPTLSARDGEQSRREVFAQLERAPVPQYSGDCRRNPKALGDKNFGGVCNCVGCQRRGHGGKSEARTFSIPVGAEAQCKEMERLYALSKPASAP